MYVHVHEGAQGAQKRESYSLELELHAVVGNLMRILGFEQQLSASAHNRWAIFTLPWLSFP